jgi:hypothetical protein
MFNSDQDSQFTSADFWPAEVQRSEISTHGKGAVMAELVGVRVAMLEQE